MARTSSDQVRPVERASEGARTPHHSEGGKDVPPPTASSHRSPRPSPSPVDLALRAVSLVYGVVSAAPVLRDAHGVWWTELDVRSRSAGGLATALTVVHTSEALGAGPPAKLGDRVLVLGTTRRRFFRTGGVTVARTEIEAAQVLVNPDRRKRRRLVDAAVAVMEAVVA